MENSTLGLNPQVARFVPDVLCRFCKGLKYPHTFIILLPTFIIGLMCSAWIPYPEQILTVLGLVMFFVSKMRWE